MIRPVALAALSLLCAGVLAAQAPLRLQQQPQPPTPTFRAGTDIVQLDVSVLDKDRQPVRGLTAANFTVLENGQPRPVVAFSAIDVPDVVKTAASWTRSVAPDVTTNDATVRRLIVIVLDDAFMPFDPGVMKFAKQIGHEVVESLGPNDLAAVTFTMYGKSQDITTDRRRLNAAIDTLVPHPDPFQSSVPRSSAAFSSMQIGPGRGGQAPCTLRDKNRGLGSCVMDTLIRVGAALRDAPASRKSLVYISAGIPIDFTMANESVGDDIMGLQEMLRSMQQANISIYAFDPTGLTPEGMIGPRFDTLHIFSEETGGRAVMATNQPWDQVPQMFRENSSYYLLAIPRSPGGPGGHRYALKVKVDRPDVEVRSRGSYFADPPASARGRPTVEPTALDRALGSGVPTGDLTMSVSAAVFAKAPHDADVVMTIGLRPRLLEPPARSFKVVTTAFDQEANFKQRGSATQTLEVRAPFASTDAPEYQMLTRLTLPRGRYQIRIAAEGGGQAGSVFADVDVPDFAKAPLSLSGLVLTDGAAAAVAGQDLVSDLIPVVPSMHREFRSDGTARAFLRVYQGGNALPVSIRVASTIVDDRNRTVFDKTAFLDGKQFSANRGSDFTMDLPLASLEAGEHLLTIEATLGKTIVKREARFTVR